MINPLLAMIDFAGTLNKTSTTFRVLEVVTKDTCNWVSNIGGKNTSMITKSSYRCITENKLTMIKHIITMIIDYSLGFGFVKRKQSNK